MRKLVYFGWITFIGVTVALVRWAAIGEILHLSDFLNILLGVLIGLFIPFTVWVFGSKPPSDTDKGHYQQLNDEVFKPLSGLKVVQSSPVSVKLSPNLPMDSSVYGKAALHLKKASSRATDELSSLPDAINKHNVLSERTYNDRHKRIMERLASVFDQNRLSWSLGRIVSVLNLVWQDCADNFDESNVLSQFKSLERGDKGEELWLDHHQVWKGTDEEKNKMMETLEGLVTDSTILGSLQDETKSKAELDRQAARISDLAKEESKRVSSGDYRVRVKGCCARWYD